ncbi:PilN domain-containing protein [Acetobacter indonesiensis]|uniref:PilN domain-containing protein n=1 Tax=Acetobacter indonesiensis TaxID=104101 RepID=UPI001F3BC0B4|nr:PilN domain-containing protein [Acetobacter indonesiensis]MCG0996307.1 PilN domain-containing protein [Acetobacter indonesiensis]
MSTLSRSVFMSWWLEQNTEVLRKAAYRYLPARLWGTFRNLQTRYALPTVVIVRDTQSLNLLPLSSDGHPQSIPATAEGMTHLANLCAIRRPLFAGWRHTKKKSLLIRVIVPDLPILQRMVRLPTTAAAEAASLVSYQMDRIVPFPPEDILWGITPLPSNQQTDAEFLLSVTPRPPLAPWLDAFHAAGLIPVSFANQADSSAACLPLATHRERRQNSARTLAIIFLFLGLLLSTPFIWQSIKSHQITGQLEDLQPSRVIAETLRSRIDALTSGSNFLNREAQRVGSPLTLLANLTRALPDTTFLESLSLKDGQVTLEGQSKEAARLIGQLEHDKAINDPKFVGPLLRLPDGRGESFTLHVIYSNQASIDTPK